MCFVSREIELNAQNRIYKDKIVNQVKSDLNVGWLTVLDTVSFTLKNVTFCALTTCFVKIWKISPASFTLAIGPHNNSNIHRIYTYKTFFKPLLGALWNGRIFPLEAPHRPTLLLQSINFLDLLLEILLTLVIFV